MNQANDETRSKVRDHYAKVAERPGASCAAGCCGAAMGDASLALGYSADDLSSVPQGADMGLGCGNPQAIAALRPGESVLDLGSGGGFDCFLAARQVGPSGRVVGVDMTPAMVTKARANAATLKADNVEFRLGEIERLPVADASIDVVLSNCVINLSPDKAAVFAEAFRVLKPGGRLAISDVVRVRDLPPELAAKLDALTGCVSGAARVDHVEEMLRASGFGDLQVHVEAKSRSFIAQWLPGSGAEDFVASATIEAIKPPTKRECCGPTCCSPAAKA